ncbi:twin-arginine translocase TatA/TatE family subunit [Deltaproteobacteria bacterium Smac51]|nr:twin-arginine translocase TatA/TatE family subunit [Deltaproteobacteria bacterium Smac51]
MGGLSAWKLLLILFVVLIVFGGRRLPELGKSLGAGIVNFRKAFRDEKEDGDSEEESRVPAVSGSDPAAKA